MRKLFVNICTAAAICTLVLATSGCSVINSSSSAVISVKTASAAKHTLKSKLDITGVLIPAQSVNISSKISGQVLNIGVDVGSPVKAGQEIVTLETKTLNAQLSQAEAALKSAEASYQGTNTQAQQSKINLDSAQQQYDRTKSLFDSGAASQSQLDDVTNKLKLAKKQYESAIGSTENVAQAAIETAKANINNIKVQLENAVITSPIDGVVTNKNINSGEIASPGVTLLTIADTTSLKLKGTVNQNYLPLLKEGQEIDVFVDVYSNKAFKGKIDKVGPMSVSTGEYFPIEISINNASGIKPGLSAHASISLDSDEGVTVPASGVVQNNGENYVFVLKGNVVSKRSVTVGLNNDSEVQITKGLDENEQIAVTNVSNLFDNMPVNLDNGKK